MRIVEQAEFDQLTIQQNEGVVMLNLGKPDKIELKYLGTIGEQDYYTPKPHFTIKNGKVV